MTLIDYTARLPLSAAVARTGPHGSSKLFRDLTRAYDTGLDRFFGLEPSDREVARATDDFDALLSDYNVVDILSSSRERSVFTDDLRSVIYNLADVKGGSLDSHSVQEFYYHVVSELSRAENESQTDASEAISDIVSSADLSVKTTDFDVKITGVAESDELRAALKKLDDAYPGILEDLRVDYKVMLDDHLFDDPGWIRYAS